MRTNAPASGPPVILAPELRLRIPGMGGASSLSCFEAHKKSPEYLRACRHTMTGIPQSTRNLSEGFMFERYTEKARRVIFFARYEASQFASPYIETEHLLLGLLREDKALTNRFLRSHASVESIRKQIEGHTTIREKVSTSVD